LPPWGYPSTWHIDNRFIASQHTPYLAHGIGYETTSVAKNITFLTAARFAHTLSDANFVEFMGQWDLPLLRFVSVGGRLSHRAHLETPRTTAHLLAYADGRVPLFHPLEGWFVIGWFERFIDISGARALPFLLSSPYGESDIALSLGLRCALGHSVALSGRLSNIDDLVIHNLNNPFVELKATYQQEMRAFLLYGQYKLLLGFGRLDEWVLGFQVMNRL